jgi:hypothetical protein
MIDAVKLEARNKELTAISKRVTKDVVRLYESGITKDSPIYQAVEREVHRISDEQIAVRELLNAVGTGTEELESRYQDLFRRSMRLEEALVAIFDAGIAAGSPIHAMMEDEVDRVHAELGEASNQRSAARENLGQR